jgi:hypothetical protein
MSFSDMGPLLKHSTIILVRKITGLVGSRPAWSLAFRSCSLFINGTEGNEVQDIVWWKTCALEDMLHSVPLVVDEAATVSVCKVLLFQILNATSKSG